MIQTRFFKVINRQYSTEKKLNKNIDSITILVFKVDIKASKLEIQNVFKNIFPFKYIRVRTLIIKDLIKNRYNNSKCRYKRWKKAYITLKKNYK